MLTDEPNLPYTPDANSGTAWIGSTSPSWSPSVYRTHPLAVSRVLCMADERQKTHHNKIVVSDA